MLQNKNKCICIALFVIIVAYFGYDCLKFQIGKPTTQAHSLPVAKRQTGKRVVFISATLQPSFR